MKAKLEAFRATLEAAQLQGLLDQGYDPERHPHAVKVKMGRKYANVDVGCRTWPDGKVLGSGKYMVELETGNIYGIKAYGVIHRGHFYGTLDTLDAYDWRGYTAFKRQLKEVA
ncbi:MAG: hypothetical protein NUV63_12100 [Gallionella sp.]|nr:hypothetical protein [Gallionella sp.]